MVPTASRAISILARPWICPHMEPDASSTSMETPGPLGTATDCWAEAGSTTQAASVKAAKEKQVFFMVSFS